MEVAKHPPRKPDESTVYEAEKQYENAKPFKAYFGIGPSPHTVILLDELSQLTRPNDEQIKMLVQAARQLISQHQINKVIDGDGNVIAEVSHSEMYNINTSDIFTQGE